MSLRMTAEDVAKFEARRAEWERAGTKREHRIRDDQEPVNIEPVRRKYGNEPTGKYASKREEKRHQQLLLLEKAGNISDLKWQVPFRMVVNEILICTYVADFTYTEDGKFVVEDSKGFITRAFRIKEKLLKAIHGHEVRLT